MELPTLPTFDRVRAAFLLRLSRLPSDQGGGGGSDSVHYSSSALLESLAAFGITRRQCDEVCERFLRTFGDVRFGEEGAMETGNGDVKFMMHLLVGASGEAALRPLAPAGVVCPPLPDDSFAWPLVDMATFEYGSRHDGEVDMKHTVVVLQLPRKRGSAAIGAVKALLTKMLRPKSLFLPKEASGRALTGTGFLAFANAAEANLAVDVLSRIVWPAQGLLSTLHEDVSFVPWEARLFRHYCQAAATSRRGSKPPTLRRSPTAAQGAEEEQSGVGLLLAVQARNAALEERLVQLETQLGEAEKRAVAAEEWLSVQRLDADESIEIAAIAQLARLSQGTLAKLAVRDNGGLVKAQADLQCTLVRLQSALQWEEQQRREQHEFSSSCVICRECPKTILLLPCRHLCVCESCANRAARSSCPVCRRGVDELVKVYVS